MVGGGGGAQYVNCLYQESKFKNNFVCVCGGGGRGVGLEKVKFFDLRILI